MARDENRQVRRIGFYKNTKAGEMDMKIVDNVLNEEELDELNAITRVVYELKPIVTAYQIAERNHEELLTTLDALGKRLIEHQDDAVLPVEVVLEATTEITQRVTNFLASVSSFLEQTEAQIKRIWGPKSQEWTAWKQKKNQLFDNRFSYRFLYHLRHFSQHSGLPLSSVQIKGTRQDRDAPADFYVSIPLDRDALVSTSFDWRQGVREEIENQPASFPIMPLLDEHLGSIGALCIEAVDLQAVRLNECACYLVHVLKGLAGPDEAVPVVWVFDVDAPQTQPRGMEFIPVTEFLRIVNVNRALKDAHTTRPA